MNEIKIYDISIIGGGLAGLCASILLAKKGHSVILFEKEKYPFHKVCGEYISMESWNFLVNEMNVPLNDLHIGNINKLIVTSPDGTSLNTDLDLGGFGISRYKLDHILKNIAEEYGVKVMDGCKVDDITFDQNLFTIKTLKENFTSKCCCGSWGKRSNIDVKWKRSFTEKKTDRLDNYVGIKYHVQGNFKPDTIELHNFKNGYCGLSKIEDDLYCLCYFMKAVNLKAAGNNIEKAEKEILSKNPYLKEIFSIAVKVSSTPVSISQVSLSRKNAVENNVLMLGDAAGMISPLCGNGMSIAMHSAKIAANEIDFYLKGNISFKEMQQNYSRKREAAFGKRIKAGRLVQSVFVRNAATNIFVKLMKRSDYLTQKIISFTHGKSF